jgi:hypothetical protein
MMTTMMASTTIPGITSVAPAGSASEAATGMFSPAWIALRSDYPFRIPLTPGDPFVRAKASIQRNNFGRTDE